MEWQPIETAPRDKRIWAWGDCWNFKNGEVAVFHSDYNGHKDVISRDGIAGPAFRLGGKEAPTLWAELPEVPKDAQ